MPLRAEGLLFGAVATQDTVLFGFGIEQIASPAARAEVLGKAIRYLLPAS